jgi:hypothetical protein
MKKPHTLLKSLVPNDRMDIHNGVNGVPAAPFSCFTFVALSAMVACRLGERNRQKGHSLNIDRRENLRERCFLRRALR